MRGSLVKLTHIKVGGNFYEKSVCSGCIAMAIANRDDGIAIAIL